MNPDSLFFLSDRLERLSKDADPMSDSSLQPSRPRKTNQKCPNFRIRTLVLHTMDQAR